MSSWSKGYSPFNANNLTTNKTGKLTIPIIQNSLPHSYVIMPALLSHIDSFNSSIPFQHNHNQVISTESHSSNHQHHHHHHHHHEEQVNTKQINNNNNNNNNKKLKTNNNFKSSKEIIYTTKRMKTNKFSPSDLITSSEMTSSIIEDTNSYVETTNNSPIEYIEQQMHENSNLVTNIHNITYTQYQISTYDLSEKTSIENSNISNDVNDQHDINTLSMINLLPSSQTTSSLVDQTSEYSNFFSSDSTTVTQALTTNSDDFAYETLIEQNDDEAINSQDDQTVTYAISFPSDWQYNIDTMLNCYVLFKNLNNEPISSKIKLKCSVCTKEFSNLNDLCAHKEEFNECKNKIEIISDEDENMNLKNNRKYLKRKCIDLNDYNDYFADEDEEEEQVNDNNAEENENDENDDVECDDEQISIEDLSELEEEEFYFNESIESDDEINYLKHNEQKNKIKLNNMNQPTTRRKYTKNKNDPKNFSNLICEECHKICRTKAEILVHRHKHAGKEPECWQCGKKCASFSNLISHVQLHTGEKPYTCQFCGKQFTQDAHLTRHIRLHTGERPFVCNICGKNYKDYSYYKTHMRIHRGERLYKCNFCNKEYYDASYYKKHTRLHTGEKPYMCTVCGRQFHRSDYLKLHSYSHTNERPFNCHICGKGFKMNYNLKLHLKNHDQEQSKITNTSSTQSSSSSSRISTNGNDSFFNDSILMNTNSVSFINSDNLVVEQQSTTTINLLSSSVANEMVSFLNEQDRNLEFLSK